MGSYAITPGGLTSGNYEITFAPGTLTVKKKTVELDWSAETSFTFDGKSHAPTATVKADSLVNGDVIGVTVDGAQTYPGENYTATAASLTGDKAGNYALPEANTQAFTIAKHAALPQVNITQYLTYTETSVNITLPSVMPGNAGTPLSYKAGTASKEGSVEVSDYAVDENGNITATLSDGAAGDSIILPVTISSDNYEDSIVQVTVILTNKEDAGVTIKVGEETVVRLTRTYGDPDFTVTAAVQVPGDNGELTWTSSNTDVATVANNGTVTVKNRGVTTLTASYESSTTFGQATVTLTVEPKNISGAMVEVSRDYTYSGIAIRPADSDVTVMLGAKVLESGVDYSFTVPNRKDVATSDPELTV